MKGLVIKNTGSWYQVKTDDGQSIECKIKGNFRLKGIRSTNPVAVGDRVQIILNQEGTAFISEIEDRKNYIVRRSSNLSKQSHILAANLDQCMLVVTINYPETSTIFIDRFLASAEAYRVPVKLVFNKVDAYDEDELRYLDALINLYTQIGYPCFKVSAKNGNGVEEIKKALESKITLFSGHSGVGKSTLINSILPGIETRTGEISSYHNKGMHTTTFSEMFPVEGNGYIIDTPGIKGFGTFDMEPVTTFAKQKVIPGSAVTFVTIIVPHTALWKAEDIAKAISAQTDATHQSNSKEPLAHTETLTA